MKKELIIEEIKNQGRQPARITYRGIHFTINKRNEPDGFVSKLLHISHFATLLDRGNNDSFVEDDTWHSHNTGQTDDEQIEYLILKAVRDIDDLLNEQVKEYQRDITHAEERIAMINAWASRNQEEGLEVVV